jgi:hypothetical protein
MLMEIPLMTFRTVAKIATAASLVKFVSSAGFEMEFKPVVSIFPIAKLKAKTTKIIQMTVRPRVFTYRSSQP